MWAALLPIPILLASTQFSYPVLVNILVLLVWFLVSAHLTSLLTGRMSIVDLAWRWGLVIIGLMQPLSGLSTGGSGWLDRSNLVMIAYLLAGGRMAMGATIMTYQGHLNEELPRYLYQRLRWSRRGLSLIHI